MPVIYADYNATTPVDPAVLNEMLPYLTDYFGNPSSSHLYGIKAREAVEQARKRIADCLGCMPYEVVFTSGGSESNNFAIKGIASANRHHGNHIITSSVEHPSVLQPCRHLEKQGFDVTYLPVDEYGMVSVNSVRDAIRNDTILITIMHANNEVGTVEPIEEIGVIAKELGIYFHTDAAQTIGKLPVNVDGLGVDLLTIAGHKFYAPKGIGALYIREGSEINSLLEGASQEHGLRAGTEAVPGIVALGKACQLSSEALDQASSHLFNLTVRLYELLLTSIDGIKLNGHPESRIPNTLNMGFPWVISGDLLASIPEIAASAGSACHADSCIISPVLKAMGVKEKYGLGSVRFSFGKWTTEDEIDDIVDLVTTRYYMLLEHHRH